MPIWSDDRVFSLDNLEKEKLFFSIEEAINEKDNAYRLCQGGRELDELPDYIGQLEMLQYFNAAQNHLLTLPETFCNLQYIQEINLAGNNIEVFLPCIGEMQYLKVMDFSSNPKIDWHKALLNLNLSDSLEELDLSYNEIYFLPDKIEFTHLKELVLIGNPISEEEMKRIKTKLKDVNIIF